VSTDDTLLPRQVGLPSLELRGRLKRKRFWPEVGAHFHPRSEADSIRDSGLFDAIWYAERNADAAAFPDPVEHYLQRGVARGEAPHPLFQTGWYNLKNPGLAKSGLSPLGHFIRHGEARGARPHPLFDPVWYRSQDPSLQGKTAGLFRHFLEHGAAQGLSPHPAFDVAYYDRVRPDVAHSGMNRLTHFVQVGAAERISPNPFFDSEFYLDSNDDVTRAADNPLIHFLLFGAAEGRRPHPDVNLSAYQAAMPDCPRDPVRAYIYLITHESPDTYFSMTNAWIRNDESQCIRKSGLFDPGVYLSLHADLGGSRADARRHFERYGIREGRAFTNCEVVARRLADLSDTLETARLTAQAEAKAALGGTEARSLASLFASRGVKIGVYCNTEGNFFMYEIAELLAWGLQALGIDAVLRNEKDSRDEPFALRVFVAPHEFFYLGLGRAWADVAAAPNTVLYNVEQMQTQWFCRAFSYMVRAPLVLDINFQTAEVMRNAGREAVHFMPGYLPGAAYTQPITDVSDIELVKGYRFAHERYDWTERDRLEDRPIDILFIGSAAPRRDKLFRRLIELTDEYRFLCVYTTQDAPLTERNYRATSTRINCALAQRAKIMLNVHRDWVGYFEWSRMVMQGFWQGACVVSDHSMPNSIFEPGTHMLEENVRHLAEMVRWLLATPDGQARLDATRRAAFEQARSLGAMDVALTPVLGAFRNLLKL
jgi:hypothetical protein